MWKRLLLTPVAILTWGCATIMNSGRPRYSGPIVKPAWHNADVRVAQTPVIHDGIVYAIARSWDKNQPQLFAFDVKTGHRLWTTDFSPAKILLVAGPNVLVADASGHVRSIDAKTGKLSSFADAPLKYGTYLNGFIYAVEEERKVRAVDPLGHIHWQAEVPLNIVEQPVAAGGTVYVYGLFRDGDFWNNYVYGVYAFDTESGTLRWKHETKGIGQSIIDFAADAGAAYLLSMDKRGNSYVGGVVALSAEDGAEKWSLGNLNIPSEVFVDRDLVVIRDIPPGQRGAGNEAGYRYQGLKSATGEIAFTTTTAWQYANSVGRGPYRFVSDRKIHEVLTENNNTSPDSWMTLVDVRTGKEVWRSETVELGVFTLPAVADGMAVVGSEPFEWRDPSRVGKREVAGLWAWSAPE